MNEWGFIGQDTLLALEKSATDCKFINRCGSVQLERLVLSNPHSYTQTVGGNPENDTSKI